MTATKIDPTEDGTKHINCWTKGRTPLGKELSNLAFRPFKHPEHGTFASVEAFWYWLGTGMKHDNLRPLHSHSAKSAGSGLLKVAIDPAVFQKEICTAIRCKIEQHEDLKREFVKSNLPFMHYFVYGRDAVRSKDEHLWQMEFLETLRKEFQAAAVQNAFAQTPLDK